MKNKFRKMLLLMCAMTLAFALTACGGSGDDADTSGGAAQTEEDASGGDDAAAEDDTSADDTADDTAAGKFASIQEFIDSDMMQKELATQLESLEGTGISMELTAEDNKLIYNFKIDDPDLSAVMDTATLESTLDSQASTFESVAGVLPAAIDIENPVIVVRYLDSDGNELASREFAPSDDTADDAAADDAADTAE
ncbi:MAG TPA: DUF4854 domain-containing protein [Candidatus Mediterraneibacter surreyensis]|nr:DUF4854 domain-containing protein [Candidatus Mediterraneibacter surreyensis]